MKLNRSVFLRRYGILLLTASAACLTIAACGGGSGSNNSNSSGSTIAQQLAACTAALPAITVPSTGNAVPVILDSGPCAYGVPFGSPAGTASSVFPIGTSANVPYTSVTICNPGSSTCQTIDHILVDTGSNGLRIMKSVLDTSIALPAVTIANQPLVECLQFADGYSWGSVRSADIHIAGERASSVPVQVIGDSGTAPAACTNLLPTSAIALNDVVSFGANGVLGVGVFTEDCGPGCTIAQGNFFYFACASSSNCSEVGVPTAQQVANPVARFPVDNNGVVLSMPQVAPAGGAKNLLGILYFGITTATNNQLTSAQAIYQTDGAANFNSALTSFTTPTSYTLNSNNCPYSFIDSGSNGIFLPNESPSQTPTPIPVDAATGPWFLPTAPRILTVAATIQGFGSLVAPTPVSFTISNASDLFALDGYLDTAFNGLGAPSGTCSVQTGGIDWGMPFFFNKNLFTAIETKTVNVIGGAQATGPFWAF